jgi:hypothetical protein
MQVDCEADLEDVGDSRSDNKSAMAQVGSEKPLKEDNGVSKYLQMKPSVLWTKRG